MTRRDVERLLKRMIPKSRLETRCRVDSVMKQLCQKDARAKYGEGRLIREAVTKKVSTKRKEKQEYRYEHGGNRVFSFKV